MTLTLSGSYLNSTYADENGRVIYKVNTTTTLPGGSSNIVKLLPDDIPRMQNVEGDEVPGDRFAHLARIDWKIYSIFHHGEELVTKQFFRRESGWAKKRNRIFMGEDGKEYKWVLGPVYPELRLNDESQTVVAKYNPGSVFTKKRPGVLEIFPSARHMMDIIVMTFVYVETARRRES
ncbi:hypothetical protein V5O48_012019 [Marasmius crinis-equi]|uniref:DUF6593 domain-containing protein n=1 Tax=Marasmius crinis-equi TaxID=585013 RepID=A0ABR3F3Z8_9AGAR